MVDLHAHTTISDGTLSPKELIFLAKKIGLSAVAITDHDNIAGLDDAQQAANEMDINLINGIEFSVAFGEGRLIHILGLDLDIKNEEFLRIYRAFRKRRADQVPMILERLRFMNVGIALKDVDPFILGEFADRQTIAKCLVSKGYALNVVESWRMYLNKIYLLEKELIEPKDAFDAIHAAGGKAFLAHFHLIIGLKGYSNRQARAHLRALKEMGLDGMEYYYPSFTKRETKRCDKYIKEFGFLKSGGTDFHGANRPHIQLGIGEGNFFVPESVYADWHSRLK